MGRHRLCGMAAGCVLLLAAWCWGQETPGLPVYIADSPAAQELVEAAQQYREQDRLTDAVAAFQQVIEEYPQKLMAVEDHLYVDSAEWVHRRLLADAELLELYRTMYEPAAQRELAEARETADRIKALEAVVARYALTGSGLEAALDLAAVYLERADPGSASSVLGHAERHPDVAEYAERFHALGAAAALLTGDQYWYGVHLDALHAADAAATAEQLEAMSLRMGDAAQGADQPFVVRDASQLPSAGESALWQRSLTDEPMVEPAPDQPRRRPTLSSERQRNLAILPVADSERLYLNVGDGIETLDRSSGRQLWSYEEPTAEQDRTRRQQYRGMMPAPDRRAVLIHENAVFAVTGEAMHFLRGMQAESSTALVKIDQQTGELVWRRTPGELHASLERGYFQGTPLPGHGVIYLAARRAQMSGFQDVFVAAVDTDTGELVWRRHVSSTITQNRYPSSPPTLLALEGSTLYVVDNLGVAAAIDTRDGGARWVRVLAENQAALDRVLGAGAGQMTGDASPPVLIKAGLIVPSASGASRMTLLDPETGRLLRELRNGPWMSARMVVPADGDVLAIGNEATLIDGASLEEKWSAAVPPTRPNAARGWPTVSGAVALVPANDTVEVLNLDDGSKVMQVKSGTIGNPILLDGQIVLATNTRVMSYMDWPLAYRRLITQVRHNPTDVGPGLALAHLAATAGQPQAVIEGVDHALAAIERHRTQADENANIRARQQVIDAMLTLVDPANRLNDEVLQGIFDRMAQVTVTPEQEVAYHFAFGGFLDASDRSEEAVDHYQAVLGSQELAGELYRSALETRRAGLEAQQRLRGLIERRGQAVYQRYDLLLSDELALLVPEMTTPEQLLELAERYPVGRDVPTALARAAELLAAQGRVDEAARQYLRAYRRAGDHPTRAQIVGAMVSMLESNDRQRYASRVLRSVQRDHPAMMPIRGGEPVSYTTWLAELESMFSADRTVLPAMRPPLRSAVLMPGNLLIPASGTSIPGDRFLVQDGGTLRMYRVDGQTLWERPSPVGEMIQVLDLTDEQALLWSPLTGVVVAIDTATGEPVWEPIEVAELVAQIGDVRDREVARPNAQREFLRQIDAGNVQVVVGGFEANPALGGPAYVVDANESVICLGDRSGRVVAVDRATGQVIWQIMAEMDTLIQMRIGRDVLALSGASGVGNESLGGVIMVVDLVSGETLGPVREEPELARWILFGGPDLLLTLGQDHIAAHRVQDGRIAWRVGVPGMATVASGDAQVWADDQLVLARLTNGLMLVLDAETGTARERMSMQNLRRPEPLYVQSSDQGWQVLSPLGTVRLSSRGEVEWRDAIEPVGRKQLIGQLLTQQHVFVVAQMDPRTVAEEFVGGPGEDAPLAIVNMPAVNNAAGAARGYLMYAIYALDRETGLIERVTPLGPVTAAAFMSKQMLLLDNHLLLGSPRGVCVVAGAP